MKRGRPVDPRMFRIPFGKVERKSPGIQERHKQYPGNVEGDWMGFQGDLIDGWKKFLAWEWGEIPPEEEDRNDTAFIESKLFYGIYPISERHGGGRFWIVTYPGDSATDYCLEEEAPAIIMDFITKDTERRRRESAEKDK